MRSPIRFCFPILTSLALLIGSTRTHGQDPGQTSTETSTTEYKLESGLVSSLKFRSIGPALMSGRVSDLAIDPQHPNTWYVGVGSGNVWKTTNAGTTFEPIFDQYGSYSIGCITIDPNHTDTVWIGTGENVGGRHIGFGDGVYRSRDGGKTFENLGLKASEHISKIVVDPRDSNVVFVASQGPLWSEGGERGLFKTTDGGLTWKNVLAKGPFTGVTDVVQDQENPDVLYAATHQRHRTVWALLNTGPESGIHKSTDGGETWRELTNGLPSGDKGKISLGISHQKSNVVYATIEKVNRQGGFYRSENNGESWVEMSDFVSGGTGPHYYQELYVDPHRFDVIYHANNVLSRSVDGGKTFEFVEGGTKHVDNHAVVFHPNDPDFLLVGCDGGVYRSNDFSKTYQFFANLPITQFYKVDVDYDLPFYHVIGGTQDNSTQYGPTATRNVQGITNADWMIPIGGDGHDNAINPANPDIIFCESQEGFIRRFDRKTGESIDVRPQPQAGEAGFRFNWDAPILISPHQSARVYFGSRVLHRSDDHGESWKTISPDLSRNQDRWKLPIMGRVWGINAGFDLLAMSMYGNITSISESPVVEGLIYVGTDDGLIQVTEDGGQTWRKIDRIFGVPEGSFINDIKADRHDPNTVYACLDNHKTGDYQPLVIRSRDRGKTWDSIRGDLPDRHLVWRLEQDHVAANLLFLGTEFGVFTTIDAGKHWVKLNSGLPNIPVRDLAIQKRENDLVAATFGRGFYVLDDYSPLRELSKDRVEQKAYLFPIRDAKWYQQTDRLGGPRGFQGDSFYLAENPSYGTVFTVHLKNDFKSKREIREQAESEARSGNKDATVPTMDELRAEEAEVTPSFYIHITDPAGNFVNRVELPGSTGLHRVVWDFRFAPLGPGGFGPLAGPGEYRASVVRLDADGLTTLNEPTPFQVKSIFEASLPGSSHADILSFQRDAFQLQSTFSKSLNELRKAEGTLGQIQSAARQSAADPSSLLKEAHNLGLEIRDLNLKLVGDDKNDEYRIEGVPGIGARLSNALFGSASSHGPTQTHRQQLEIAKQEFNNLRSAADDLVNKVTALKQQAESVLGVPLSDQSSAVK